MSLRTQLTTNASQLPFFCSTNALIFYLDDPTSFSQVLTLYNPYDFAVRYKILCTAPAKYSIAEPQGEISPQHSVDKVVRLLDTSPSSTNQNNVHKIRIQFFNRQRPQDAIGKRDVDCSILSYKPLEPNSVEERGSTIRNRFNTTTTVTGTNSTTSLPTQETRDPLLVIVLGILGAICALILVLPMVPEDGQSPDSRIPSYLHMTTNAKIIAGYILGLLTVVFIRR